MPSSIGLDVGHSAVKVATDATHFAFPSAAIPAVTLSTETARRQAESNLVELDGKRWLVGEPALTHTFGHLADGLRDNWIATPEYAALFKAGFQRVVHDTGDPDPVLAVALPSRLYQAQQQRLVEIASSVTGVSRDSIVTLPQPLAAFMALTLDENGVPVEGENSPIDGTWAVIDIGYYTTDFGYISRGVWSEAGARSMDGASTLVDGMRDVLIDKLGIEANARDCDAALRASSIRCAGKVVDLTEVVEAIRAKFAQAVQERAERVFGAKLMTATGVLVVGGGAQHVGASLQGRWPHVVVPHDARFAVAEGLRRSGLAYEAEEVA